MTEQTATGVPTRLENLQPGLRLSGLLPQTVSILAVAAHGPDAVTVTFQGRQRCPGPEAPLPGRRGRVVD